MKNMYEVQFTIPTKPNTICLQYNGGDSEEELKARLPEMIVEKRKVWHKETLTVNDVKIKSVKYVGEYNRIMEELSNDRS